MGPSAGNAGIAAVGVTSTSTSSKSAASFRSSARRVNVVANLRI
jgi:hypothetical protein